MTEDRKPLLTAYGLLWLFQGTGDNAKLAHEARRQLLGMLDETDRIRAVRLAQDKALELRIDPQEHVRRAHL